MSTHLEMLLATVPRLRELPRREIRALRHDPYRTCLAQLDDALAGGERLETLTCATSASRGRGVLALTDSRLVLATIGDGFTSWRLADIDSVQSRPANFTMPAAIYIDTGGTSLAIVVGAGRKWGPRFTEAVRVALQHRSLPQAA
jgi:hypothetical protein